MTQEEKELLKDLCTRLPYGVVCECSYNKENGSSNRLKICSEGILQLNADVLGLFIEDEINLLPYLRPMTDMTENERWNYDYKRENHTEWEAYDYLNSIHIDYRGLIQMGLVLEAPEGMYE